MNQRNPKPSKPWTKMTAEELAEATKDLENLRFEDTRPLNAEERALWNRMKRASGRPRKAAGEKAARVLVTVAPDLLKEADAYAKKEGITRSQLVAQGLMSVIRRRKAG